MGNKLEYICYAILNAALANPVTAVGTFVYLELLTFDLLASSILLGWSLSGVLMKRLHKSSAVSYVRLIHLWTCQNTFIDLAQFISTRSALQALTRCGKRSSCVIRMTFGGKQVPIGI